MRTVKAIVAGLAVSTSALSAFAQQNQFRLDLFLVARSISGPVGAETVTDIQEGGQVQATPGIRYWVEVRYRIADLVADNVGSRGFAAADLQFTRSGTGTGTTSRGFLTFHQQESSTVVNPDSSGITTAADGPTTGLIGPYRGGLPNDTGAANSSPDGTSTPPGTGIRPTTLAVPNHRSWTDLTAGSIPTPSAANTNANLTRWALYTFDFVYGSGSVEFSVAPLADPFTFNAFGYFAQVGSNTGLTFRTDRQFTPGTIAFVPSPAAAASVLALLGMSVVRRRRSLASE